MLFSSTFPGLVFIDQRWKCFFKPTYTGVTAICIASNYWCKHRRKMVIRGIKLTGKQPATIEIPHWVHSLDTRLHYRYTSDFRSFACGDYQCHLWAPSTGGHSFTCGALSRPWHTGFTSSQARFSASVHVTDFAD